MQSLLKFVLFSGIAIIAVIAIVLILSPFIKPEVWISGGKIKVRKYFRTKVFRFGEIRKIAMTTIAMDSDMPGGRVVTLKLTMNNGEEYVLNGGSGSGAPRGAFSLKKYIKNEFSSFDDHSLLPSPADIKEILAKNEKIEFDEYTKSYLEQGNCEAFLRVIDAYKS